MKLTKIRVENFRCVEDSNEFTVDQVTCLVGKNEAGKTALLEALYKLNPVESDARNFIEEEFPRRHLATYKQRRERTPATILTTYWELSDADVADLEETLGPGCLDSREIIVSKGYENTLVWTFDLNEGRVVDSYVTAADFNASDKAPLTNASSIPDLVSSLKAIESPTDKQSQLLQRLTSIFPDQEVHAFVQGRLAERLPLFIHFRNYDHLPGRLSLDDIKQRKDENTLNIEHKIFLALLEMTSTSLEEIEGIDQLEKLIMELESVEAALTDEVRNYWSQNQYLEVRFRYDKAKPNDPPPFNTGFVFNTRIFNTRHRATVSFEYRSHGFIWFFSFLVWFSQMKQRFNKDLILLLDEPGLSLHGRAQEDLIRYINEKLRPHHQVIYTAHSPFMLDIENINSLRTVEDVVVKVRQSNGEFIEEIKGTKVGERILSRDKDTLFPLQGILGFNMAQTLFVGPYVVVVEGPTERALFDWFSRQLAHHDRESLDLRWAVCPAEGASKISSFVTLFSGRELKIAVFADYHDGQKGTIDRLENTGLLPTGHVLRTSTYSGQDESDIEDLIGRPMYIELTNAAMELPESHRLPATKPENAPERVVKEVENHCCLLPPGFSEFNHYMPVEYLMTLKRSEVEQLPGIDEALERFERVFKDLNALIAS